MAEARIDKWMWAVRIFKTRTIAAEACKMNRVTINGAYVKASRMIKPGDVVQVKKPPITYSFKVLQAIEKRVGAKLVPDVMENVTSEVLLEGRTDQFYSQRSECLQASLSCAVG